MGPEDHNTLEYIFREFGSDDLFRILASKLRLRVIRPHPTDPRTSTSSENPPAGAGNLTRHVYSPPEILSSALYTLINIAAGGSRHKSLLIAQPKLLDLILPLLSHPEPSIRASCCWIVYNLAWNEDSSDLAGSRDRARKLVELGFFERVRKMSERDEDLNCKERARNAVQVLQQGLR